MRRNEAEAEARPVMRIAHQNRYKRDTRVTRQIFTQSDAGAEQVVHQLILRFYEVIARSREKSYVVPEA